MRISASAKLFHALRSSVAVACLLALFVTSASCLHTVAHPQAACSHCAHRIPVEQHAPPCCNATHHPPATFVCADIHQPALLATAIAAQPALLRLTSTPISTQASETPPRPPLIALRI